MNFKISNLPGFFIICAFIIPISLESAFSDKGKEDSKLGDITSSRGVVLIQSKGEWKKLDKIPAPIYNTDKIVTSRGRAEFTFKDNSVLRLNLDSHVSINQQNGNKNYVNVSIGDVSFDTFQRKDFSSQLNVKTPTLTAEVDNLSGQIKVDASGQSNFGISEKGLSPDKVAKAYEQMKGSFNKIPNPQLLSNHDITFAKMPLSDPALRNSLIQTTAAKAVMLQERIQRIEESEKLDLVLARALNQRAKELKTESAIVRASKAEVKSANIQSKIAIAKLEASIAGFSQIIAEAKVFKLDSTNPVFAQEMKKTGEYLVNLRKKMDSLSGQTGQLQNKMETTQNAIHQQAISSTANTITNTINTYLAVVSSLQTHLSALSTGDEKLIKIAKDVIERNKNIARKNEDFLYMSTNLEKEVTKAINFGKEKNATASALAANSLANVTLTFSSFATNSASISLNALSADTSALENAVNLNMNFNNLSSVMNVAAVNAIQNASLGNVDQVQKSFEVTETGKEAAQTKNFSAMNSIDITKISPTGAQTIPALDFGEVAGTKPATTETTGKETYSSEGLGSTTKTTPLTSTETSSDTYSSGSTFSDTFTTITTMQTPIIEPQDLPTASPSQ